MFSSTVFADVTAKAVLSPPDVPIFRTATYVVELEGPKGLATPAVELSGKITEGDLSSDPKDAPKPSTDLVVTPGSATVEPLGEDRERVRVPFTLDALAPGRYHFPKQTLDLGNGQKAELPALTLNVHAPTEEEVQQATQFVDIGDPAIIAPPKSSAWVYALGGVALLGAIAGLLWYLNRRNKEEVWTPPALKPWQVAHNRLEELASRRLAQQGRFEPYYVDLSAILRYYIEDRFHLRAPERTTPEFLDEASRGGLLNDTQQATLAKFLRHCDRVKFAQYEPSFEEMETSFEAVRQFVIETTPTTTEQQHDVKEAA